MKIKSLMIPDPITITEKSSITEAIDLMKVNSIRHLPVVGKNKTLKGFITLSVLKQGLVQSMIGALSLTDLIIKNPITVSPDEDIEIAAQKIYKNKIGGVPVVEKNKLVGIITVTDILGAFINMMGLLTASSRIDVIVGDKKDSFNKAIQIIQEMGGDIISVGMTANRKGSKRTYYFRLSACQTDSIRSALEKEGFKVESAID
ncbi:MAG: CBS and ACT domain-containing protein [Proteobacteria bacterium]|nr:CBS and ACT domain-containing protein [Pseudomonadota bacterium]